jgi:hypothetical protein
MVGSLLCFLFARAIATKLNRCSRATSRGSCMTRCSRETGRRPQSTGRRSYTASRCPRATSSCPGVAGRCSCAMSFLTLDVGYVEFLVGCLLILWHLMLSVNLRTKTRQVTYLVCLVGSLRDEKPLYFAYITACLSFTASTLRLDLYVRATSFIACSVTGVTICSL